MFLVRYIRYEGCKVLGEEEYVKLEKGISCFGNDNFIFCSQTLAEFNVANLEILGFEREYMKTFLENGILDWCNSPVFSKPEDGYVRNVSMSFNLYDENDIEGAVVLIKYPWNTVFKCTGQTIFNRGDGKGMFIGILKENEEIDIILPEELQKNNPKSKVWFRDGKLIFASEI